MGIIKKLLVIFFVVFLLVSCDISIRDSEGFSPYTVARMKEGDALVRSTDGFIVEGAFYREYVGKPEITVINALPHDITISVFYKQKTIKYVVTNSLTIEQ